MISSHMAGQTVLESLVCDQKCEEKKKTVKQNPEHSDMGHVYMSMKI